MSEIPKFDTEYIMQIWKDELEDPDGGIIQEGTPYNELRMMYIEKGIRDAHAAVVALSLWLADKYAAFGHGHEGVYSPITHNHDTAYAAKTHDHDGVYATASHNHSGVYEPVITKKSGFNLDKSDGVTSTSSSVLATSKAVKVAYDKGVEALNAANTAQSTTNGKEPAFAKNSGFNLSKSDSVSSSSSSVLATSAAARTAYNKGVEALNKANTKTKVTVSTTAPAGAVDGDLWINPNA
jgi:hypothetical protein